MVCVRSAKRCSNEEAAPSSSSCEAVVTASERLSACSAANRGGGGVGQDDIPRRAGFTVEDATDHSRTFPG